METLSVNDLEAVKRVVEYLRHHPEELHRDELQEFRAYLVSLGASLPQPRTESKEPTKEEESDEELNTSEPDDERWELEKDISDDNIPLSTSADPTPEEEEKAAELKAAAAESASQGNKEEAVEKMGEALRLVPGKAMYWSQRASYLLDCARPGAALRDASRALDINPQNVRALRVRGTVNRHLGKWEDALKDLGEAQTIDYDEHIDGLLKFVKERLSRRRQALREKQEKEERKREEAIRRQREQEQREREQESSQKHGQETGGFPGGAPGGFPGGFPGGAIPPGMEELLNDPEFKTAMQDPEVAAKLATLMQNPMAAMQMMGDPKMGPLMQKMMSKMMGGGGFPGGFPGGAPGGFPGGKSSNANTHSNDDLD
ncbi:putative Hsc70-interacting protein (Hip) [Trypanosoma theileri]|uniref:Putative Hsc70-interacting protein (Hip) n=1 Tax=Trypanosoma theileri TaxID=67003 RepID=A0A1X0NZI2_9TRYP|nr:putative Hsc70-interacting protein (Hip) [Trypanosoma theileri]ORC90085.1 putative Hsc70-interacting protein (Hip) [Trypanosoma theileri]